MTSKQPHPLVGPQPDLSDVKSAVAVVEHRDGLQARFYADHFDQLWYLNKAGAKLRKVGGKWAFVATPDPEALEYLAKYAQTDEVGVLHDCYGTGTWGDMLGDIGPGLVVPDPPPGPAGLSKALEENAEGRSYGPPGDWRPRIVGFSVDEDGLVVHSPIGDTPLANRSMDCALEGRGWPEVIEKTREHLERYLATHGERNRLIVALCDDETRAKWVAVMARRDDVLDAVALGELDEDEASLIRWAFNWNAQRNGDPRRARLASAALARVHADTAKAA